MATSTTTSTTTAAVTTKDMKSKQLYLSMPRVPPKVYLETVNPQITCFICKGYLIDATTIVECLHSFCRSCIMLHLRHKTYCPSCEMMINKVKPNIKPDATLQAIVYKLVPGLYEKELLRRRAFYKLRTKEALEATPEQRGDDTEHLIFGPNESISLTLEYSDNDNSHQTSDDENSNSSHEINSSEHCDDDFEVLLRKPKYLQCPAIFTISNLKKFLLHKFGINSSKFCVEIMYKVKSIALPDHYTLMDVAYIFTWKRDAPMKFFYCVRAAHLPVPNIELSAVMYDLPPKRFQANSQMACASDSTDHEQESSDGDSEARLDRIRKEPEVNGSDAPTSQEEPINSTSDEPSSAPSSSTPTTSSLSVASSSSTLSTHSTMKATSSATVTSTSIARTSLILKVKPDSNAQASVNGSENQKKESSNKVDAKDQTATGSTTTIANRLDSTVLISTKTEPLPSTTEKKQTDRKSNGSSPKPNTSKSRSSPDIKPSVSPSRTNQDLKDSKEKVKTKSIMLDSSIQKSTDSSSNRSEPKTVTFFDKPSSSSLSSSSSSSQRSSAESKSTPNIDRSKERRLLFNKEEKAKSLSPLLSAENEYDFDQHLQKEEKLSEKKKFLSSIHLTPRIPSTDSPLVQSPKMPKTEQKSEMTTLPTNLSKDKDSNTKSPTSNSQTMPIRPSVSSSSSSNSNSSSSSTSSSSNSSNSGSSSNADMLAGIKKPENKTSKRKSREPVKNIAKAKCVSPNDRTIETKWDPLRSKNTVTATTSTLASNPSSSNSNNNNNNNSNSSNNAGDRPRKAQGLSSEMSRMLSAMTSQQAVKSQLKPISSSASSSTNKSNHATSSTPNAPAASKPVFKTPAPSSSKESTTQSTGLKQQRSSQSSSSTSTSETSIIINNVQRPNQADTPRPPMSFKPLGGGIGIGGGSGGGGIVIGQQPAFFSFPPNFSRNFPNETEIQEIRNDDASKIKVYGPPIPNASPNDLMQMIKRRLEASNRYGKSSSMSYPLTMPALQLSLFQNFSPPFEPINSYRNNKQRKQVEPKHRQSSTNDNIEASLQNNSVHPAFKALSNEFQKQQQQQQQQLQQQQQSVPQSSFFPSCRIPASLSITEISNDEGEPLPGFLNTKYNNKVENSIEIVKLPDESGAESNTTASATTKFSSPSPSSSTSSSSSSSLINKNVSNQLKHMANQQNNQIDSTSSISQIPSSYQEHFEQALKTFDRTDSTGLHAMETFKNMKKAKQSPDLQSLRPNSFDVRDRKHEAQKRSQHQIEERAAKIPKIQMAAGSQLHHQQQQQKSQQKMFHPAQRPVPDLLIPTDDRKMLATNSGSSSSLQTPTSSKNALANNSKSSSHHDRQSPTVSSNVSSTDKATTNVTVAVAQAKIQTSTANETSKYTPLQTSSTPLWQPNCPPELMASTKVLAQNLTKQNPGTIVD